jgi:hypothetical protein
MSSTYSVHGAAECIDGLWATFCHTQAESSSPWLSAQLSATAAVSYVVIKNRLGCCQDRLSPLQVWIGTSAGDYNSATSQSCGVNEVDLTVPSSVGPFSFRCADAATGLPHSGSYVTVVLPVSAGGTRTLNIGEIEAYAS